MEPNKPINLQLPKVESTEKTAVGSSAIMPIDGAQDQGTISPSQASMPSAISGASYGNIGMTSMSNDFTEDNLPAEDVDLIEKAWVEKAKSIVNETQGDPYSQNRRLSKIKAEYVKKRYNKDIKLNE